MKFIDFYDKHMAGETPKDGEWYELEMPYHFYAGITHCIVYDTTESVERYKQEYDQIVKTHREWENAILWGKGKNNENK